MYSIYEITCQTPNHFYVGNSCHINHRIRQHREGNGAAFVRRHGYLSHKIVGSTDTQEHARTLETDWFNMLRAQGKIVGGVVSMDLTRDRGRWGARGKATKLLSSAEQ